MDGRTQGALGVAAAQLILGTLGVCVVESGADSLSIAFYRCAFASAALGLYAALRGELSPARRPPLAQLGPAILTGLLMVGNWLLFFEAIRWAGVALATIAFHVQPFFALLLSAAIFRERLRAATLAWIALALAGLSLSAGLGEGEFTLDRSQALGVACALGGALLYSLVLLAAKGLNRVSAPQLTLIQCLCGAVLLVFAAPLSPADLTGPQWGWLALIGLLHTGGVYGLLYAALPKLSTALAAVLLFLYPASAICVDALVYGRAIGPSQSLGFGLILLASLGVSLNWGVRARGHGQAREAAASLQQPPPDRTPC